MKNYHSLFLRHQITGIVSKVFIYTVGFYFFSTAVLAQTADTLRPLLFVENPDNFPANDRFVSSKVQIPWSRDSVNYNSNHDSVIVRIRNKGSKSLIVRNIILTDTINWKFVKLKGIPFVSASSLPITIATGKSADLTIKFVAADAGTRVKILYDTLTIVSNDSKQPLKTAYLSGLWQKQGEGNNEPYLQEIITSFGYKTRTGFGHTDPDKGDTTKPKGDEIIPSFFVRADTSRPVSIRQMSAYHSCCTATELITWYSKGTKVQNTVFTHIGRDAQSVLPRKGLPNSAAAGVFNPTTPFGFRVGYKDNTDASKDSAGKIGIRVLKSL